MLLRRDVEVIRLEYQRFLPYFHAMLSGIQVHHVSSLIQKELSGIYSNEQSQKRVIRFFTTNYMKKIYNILKTTIERPHDMISEEDEGKEEKEGREGAGETPPLNVTLARMIGEYLSNGALFEVEKEKGSKNLAQHMYEWETTSE